MARYVKFPGTAGSYASTDDVNLLDADTAHMFQTVGGWVLSSPVQVNDADAWSGKACQYTDIAGNTSAFTDQLFDVVTGSTEYNTRAVCKLEKFSDITMIRFFVQFRDSGGGVVGNTTPVEINNPGSAINVLDFGAFTTPAGTERIEYNIRVSATVGGNTFNVYDAIIVEGAVLPTTFVPSLRIVGDLDLRAKLALDDWTPAADSGVIAKWGTTENSYSVNINTSGHVRLLLVGDSATSSVPVPKADGEIGDLKVTFDDAANLMHTYVDDIEIGTAQSLVVSLQVSDSPVTVGARNDGGSAEPLAGDIYNAEVRDGIDGPIVAQFNAEDIPIS